jgi:hypothetical protein
MARPFHDVRRLAAYGIPISLLLTNLPEAESWLPK